MAGVAALALALMLGLGPGVGSAWAQEADIQRAVTAFIKAAADFPDSYRPLSFGKLVKLAPGGPYVQAIRHRYRILNAEAGGLVTYDEIFYFDTDGNLVGATNTSRFKHRAWGAGKEKW